MAIRALVNQTLQLQIAQRMGLNVAQKEVTDAINHIASSNHITVEAPKRK